MRRIFAIILITSICISSMGCATQGGTIGGLVPAPKFLKGNVKSNRYTAPKNVFSVNIPYEPGSNEWKWAKVGELENGPVTAVVFGPAAFDRNEYHAVLIRHVVDGPVANHMNNLFAAKVRQRSGTFKKIGNNKSKRKGKIIYQSAYESSTAFLVLTYTHIGNAYYVVEADVPKEVANISKLKNEISNWKWVAFNNFYRSFRVHKI